MKYSEQEKSLDLSDKALPAPRLTQEKKDSRLEKRGEIAESRFCEFLW
jgi:hypothetical protein